MAFKLKTLRDPEVVLKQLASKLSLSMLDVAQLLVLSDTVPLAAWGFERDGRECIYLNRGMVKVLPDEELMLLVKHEILHRAAYHEEYDFPDAKLGNIALDIVINRILALAYPQPMAQLCRRVYSANARDSVLALADASLLRGDVPEQYWPLWDSVWTAKTIPSAYLLYFALYDEQQRNGGAEGKPNQGPPPVGWGPGAGGNTEHSDSESSDTQSPPPLPDPADDFKPDARGQLGMFDFEANQIQPREELGQAPPATPVSEPPDKACRYYRELPKRLEPNETQVLDRAEETAQETLGQIQQLGVPGNGFAASLGRFFHKLAIVPETTRTEEIEQFLSQIRSKTESDNAISQLMTAIGAEARVTVLPNSLTPTGMFMAACGVSDTTGLWWSEVPYEQRPKVRIYVDTSPSMEHWRGKCVYVIDSIKEELPIAMYAFASRVMPIAVEAFAKGEYPSDNSTSFNAVIADILRNEETLAVIFTDGYALVSDDLMAEFKTTDKELYTILLGSDGDRRSNGLDLKHLSLATMSLHVRD